MLSPPSIPTTEVRPLSKAPIPQLLPGRRNMAAHCSRCVFTAVSVHLDGLNAEDKFRVWVTILGHTPLPFPFPLLFCLSLEPLAQAIRKSEVSIKIHDHNHSTSLYTDDIILYLQC